MTRARDALYRGAETNDPGRDASPCVLPAEMTCHHDGTARPELSRRTCSSAGIEVEIRFLGQLTCLQ